MSFLALRRGLSAACSGGAVATNGGSWIRWASKTRFGWIGKRDNSKLALSDVETPLQTRALELNVLSCVKTKMPWQAVELRRALPPSLSASAAAESLPLLRQQSLPLDNTSTQRVQRIQRQQSYWQTAWKPIYEWLDEIQASLSEGKPL